MIASTTPVTTTLATLVDDTEASQTFTLDASKVVLVIYQANNVHGATMIAVGMQNAIKIDESDFANSWDSAYINAYCVRNTMVFVGTLAAGSHTIKGRFASNSAGQTVTISNRVLLIIIFDGDEFQYVDDATTATAPDGTLIDDPNAQVTFTPSATCKALILYNISNNGATESTYGKKAAIRVATTDYAQAEKSPGGSNYADSVFTCHALSLSAVSMTVKGRFANSRTITGTVTIHRRQLAVLLLADSTLLDIVASTTQVSTTSNTLVDDTQATINRTTTDTRELLVVAVGTKRYNVSSALTGECYGIKVDANDRVNSRGSPGGSAYANSAGTAYAEQLAADVHTVQGRFSNNTGTDTAKISARQVIALWFSVGIVPIEKGFSDVGGGSDEFLNPYRAMPFSDVGHGAEAFNTPFRSMGFADVGAGADVFVIPFKTLGFADVGHGTDAFIVLLQKSFADAGSGLDAFVKEVLGFLTKNFSDVGQGVDVFAIPFKGLGFSDSGHGVDVFIIPFKALGFSDVGYGTDTFLIVFKTVFFSDASYGNDSFGKYIPGAVKVTKLFLVIGDLAIQISGD